MFSKVACKRYLRSRSFWISALVLLTIFVGLIVYARSRPGKHPFELAEDFPRGPLVYAQFADLPALVKQWDQSHLKQQYLDSANYKQFQHGHLALKLIERWEEFNSALSFPLDTAAISSTADAGAAVAIYDMGRLDLVFIAPMSDEKVAATKFFTGKAQFEETESPDGTTYYRHEVEADRGRQKQVLAFAALKGRFILATSEPLLLRTIANIKGKSPKDRLWDDPAFKNLSSVVSPHFATVWVDQAELNGDYYFKHYWLMQNVAQLKTIRACMFDLELRDGEWIERRDFLSTRNEARKSSQIPAAEVARMLAQIPDDVPLAKVEALGNDPTLASSLIHDTLLDRPAQKQERGRSWSWQRYSDDDFYPAGLNDEGEDDGRYSYLSPEYESAIDDPIDAKISRQESPGPNPLGPELEQQIAAGLQQAIAPAHPLAAVVATSPRTIAGPLFVEFRRVAILTLEAPANLNRQILEAAISKAAQSRLTVAGPSANLKWVSHDENNQSWRELELPMLGWHFCYGLRGRELIVANSPELLSAVLANSNPPSTLAGRSDARFDDLTIIRLDQRKTAFDDVFDPLDAENKKRRQQAANQNKDGASVPSEEFFSANIGSLLDVAANVTRIEIKRSSFSNRRHEEIDFILK